MNVYDFDKTICFKDSTLGFWKFCIKKKPIILICLPIQFLAFLLIKFKLTNKMSLFYIFLKFFHGDESIITEFCDIQEKNICQWYLDQKESADIIVSASPEFLIKELCDRIGVKCVASKVDFKTGKYKDASCSGIEKVRQFYNTYPKAKINKCYGNAESDRFILECGNESYMVKNISREEVKMKKYIKK